MEPLTLVALGLWLFGRREEATMTETAVPAPTSTTLLAVSLFDPNLLPGDENAIDPQDAETWRVR